MFESERQSVFLPPLRSTPRARDAAPLSGRCLVKVGELENVERQKKKKNQSQMTAHLEDLQGSTVGW